MSSYVYGVIPAADAAAWPGADGLSGGGVRAIVAGDLAALVSDISDDAKPGRREDLEAHRRVLGQAVEQGTVIPMRFGMIMDDDDVVRERLLSRHAEQLGELVHELDGKVQMTVRAFYAEDALLRTAIAGDDEIARLNAIIGGRPELETHTERVALGERVAAAIDKRRARDEEALLERIRPLASDIHVDPPGSDRVALSAQLLVRRDARPALDATIAELGPALEGYLAMRYLGPLPPYSFSSLELEPEEHAQAAKTGEQ
jgi:Gas vesicle synthesis protein GvpL/GvpF